MMMLDRSHSDPALACVAVVAAGLLACVSPARRGSAPCSPSSPHATVVFSELRGSLLRSSESPFRDLRRKLGLTIADTMSAAIISDPAICGPAIAAYERVFPAFGSRGTAYVYRVGRYYFVERPGSERRVMAQPGMVLGDQTERLPRLVVVDEQFRHRDAFYLPVQIRHP